MASKVGFNALRKLSPKKRQEMVKTTDGMMLLSLLTPAQVAELFPDYYKRGLPDVSGFRAAISRKTQEQQQTFEQSVSERLGIDPKTGRPKGEEGASIKTSGSLAQNQKEAYKAARAEGLSDKAARILVANLSGENLKNPGGVYADPSSRNPNQRAHGIAAWEGSRAERIKNQFGKYPQEMSVADQTKAAIWEMKTYYPKAWAGLNDENLPDNQRMGAVVGDFERPKDVAGGVSDRMGYLKGLDVEEAKTEQSKTSADVSKSSAATGSHYGESEQCVALSKHFAPQVGRASSWRVNFNPQGIKAGSVIATMSYNDGSGGKMAKDMPDGKSHYHTGIAMGPPDANGNVLILDQSAGRGSAVHMINIHDYHGEKWGIVEGGEPTERTLQAVDVGKKLADKSQLAMIEGAAVTASPKQAAPPPPGPIPDKDAPEQPARDPQKEQPVQDPKGVPKQDITATVEKRDQQAAEKQQAPTAEVAKTKEKTFVLNKEAFLSNIEKAHPEAAMFGYTRDSNWKETIKGFQEAGIPFKITKQGVELTVDPSDPRYTQAVEEMRSNGLDQSVFLSEKKVEAKAEQTAPKPPEQKPEAKATPTQEEAPPPAFAGGGKTRVKGSLSFVPIPPTRGDDTMVTDASGKKFTMNRKKENISVDSASSTATITHRKDLGAVAAKYESGGRGVETVSSGRMGKKGKDPGGVSYGMHQLSSRTPRAKVQTGGTMGVFLRSEEGAPYRERFAGLKPGTPEFSSVYKQIAAENPQAFGKSQHDFITRTHYEPVRQRAMKLGYNVEDPRVQEALYSISVQHGPGGANRLLRKAAGATKGGAGEQVNAIFDVRSRRFPQFVKGRYAEERRQALAFAPAKEPAPVQVAAQDRTPAPGAGETTPMAEGPQATTKGARPPEKGRLQKLREFATGEAPALAAEPSPNVTTPKGASDVTPSQKVQPVAGTPDRTQADIQSMKQQLDQFAARSGEQPTDRTPPTQQKQFPMTTDSDFMSSSALMSDKRFMNPAMERAMQRAVAGTETDAMHGHFSLGNK